MKVLSLLQPWATLVVTGAKKLETRSWQTKYGGPILIHASKKMSFDQKLICRNQKHFEEALIHIDELPLGEIIGRAYIQRCITSEDAILMKEAGIPLYDGSKNIKEDWEREIAFGDYSPGRYIWLLKDPVSFTHHIPVKGSLSLWEFNDRICLKCGCTETDCRYCIAKTGQPCSWAGENLCSACV